LVARCGISREAARRALLGLERAGVVRHLGSGRAVRYAPVTAAELKSESLADLAE